MVFSIYGINIYIILIILFTLQQYTMQYQYVNLNSHECLTTKRRKIKLLKEQNSGLIINQNRISDHPIQWHNCKFEISGYSDGGIIVVIQHLSLRRNASGTGCLDYVQFFGKDGSASRRFCGRFNAALQMDSTFVQSDSTSSGNSFIDYKGEVEVQISISTIPLQPEEELELQIAFTAFRTCPLGSKEKNYDLKPCTPARKLCIYSKFFNDSVVNCPSLDCVDEMGCSVPKPPVERTNSDQIFYGALSSVFISFFVFVICILIFKARKIWCFHQNCYESRTENPTPVSTETRTLEMRDQAGGPSPVRNPTAATAPAATEEDKDLPPAYETLFPER